MWQVGSGLIPAAVPSGSCLVPQKNKRQIRPKRSDSFMTTNIVDNTGKKNIHCYAVDTTKRAIYKYTFSEDSLCRYS